MASDDVFGSGIKLDQDWDIEVDGSGDLATVSGKSELEKDMSMLVTLQLQKKLGNQISSSSNPNSLKDIELLIKRMIQSDERVQRVPQVNVYETQGVNDSISAEVQVVANDRRNYELVIEVSD